MNPNIFFSPNKQRTYSNWSSQTALLVTACIYKMPGLSDSCIYLIFIAFLSTELNEGGSQLDSCLGHQFIKHIKISLE